MLNIDRILVPTDFSEHAQQALAYARALAAAYGARIELLHIIEEAAFPAFYALGADAMYGEVPDLEERARAALQRLADERLAGERGVSCHVRKGRAAGEIAGLAEDGDVDLIVIASHGLTGLERLMMGSVAEKVVRLAPCPIFVVKSFGRSLLDEAPPRPEQQRTKMSART